MEASSCRFLSLSKTERGTPGLALSWVNAGRTDSKFDLCKPRLIHRRPDYTCVLAKTSLAKHSSKDEWFLLRAENHLLYSFRVLEIASGRFWLCGRLASWASKHESWLNWRTCDFRGWPGKRRGDNIPIARVTLGPTSAQIGRSDTVSHPHTIAPNGPSWCESKKIQSACLCGIRDVWESYACGTCPGFHIPWTSRDLLTEPWKIADFLMFFCYRLHRIIVIAVYKEAFVSLRKH